MRVWIASVGCDARQRDRNVVRLRPRGILRCGMARLHDRARGWGRRRGRCDAHDLDARRTFRFRLCGRNPMQDERERRVHCKGECDCPYEEAIAKSGVHAEKMRDAAAL